MRLARPAPEQARNLFFTAIDGALERRVAPAVPRLDMGAAFQKSGGNFDVSAAGRHVKRSAALDAGRGVDVGSSGDERADDFRGAWPFAFVG